MIPRLIRNARATRQALVGKQGIDVTAKEARWTTNTATIADERKRGGAFRRHVWLEGYETNGQRNRPCDADVVRLIETWIEVNFGDSSTNAPDISSLADQLAANPGCDDPLALAVTGLVASELHEKKRRLEKAYAGFQNSRHKAYPKLIAAVELIESESNPDRVRELFNNAGRWLNECFADGSFRPEDQPEVAEIFLHRWGYNFFYRARQSIYPIPQTAGPKFEWLARVFEGEFHIMEAWKARGGGYANTVTEDGWKTFASELAAARKSLTRAWNLQPGLPIAPTRMIYVAMGDTGAEEMRLWFDRALAAQIDYQPAWDSMRWGMRPRWHGSHEAMLALGKTAIRTRRFDTDVPRKFIDVLNDLDSDMELPFGQHLFARPDVWPELVTLYEGYIAEPSQEKNRTWWRSAYMAVAYLARKYDVARQQLEATNWEPEIATLAGWGKDLSLMPLEVAARTGPLGAKVNEAEKRFAAGVINQAIQQYQEIARDADSDAKTTLFTKYRLAALELEKRLAAGEWVDLFPQSTNHPAWEIALGVVHPGTQGIEVASDKNGHLLYSRARVGFEFEVRGEFEVVKTSNEEFQAGIVFGHPNMEARDWYSFRMKRNRDEGEIASYASTWSKQQVSNPVALGQRNTFEFQFQQGKVSAKVNGKPALADAQLKGSLRVTPAELYVGLGAYNDMNETVLRYTGVQVRRLAKDATK
jgi:hypothetical protein